MVVIFLPATSPTMVWHERTASPFTCTVQAPHSPAPQPNFVPVICNCSRIAQRSGVSFAASTDILRPLMVRVGIGVFPCRCMKPLTAATCIANAHRVGDRLGHKHDRVHGALQMQSGIDRNYLGSQLLCVATSALTLATGRNNRRVGHACHRVDGGFFK